MANNQTFTLNIKALFDASDVKNKVGDIQNALKNIKLPDTLKRSLDTSFVGVNKALDDFNSKVSKGVKTKTDATGITRSFDNVTKELDNLDKLLLKVKSELGEGVDLSQIIRIDGETKTKVEQLKNEIGELQKKISAITTEKLDALKEKLDKITSPAASKHAGEALKLFEEGDVQGAINLLDQVIAKQEQIKKATEAKGNNTSNIQNNIEQLTALRDIMAGTLPEVQQYNDEIGQKGAQAAELLNNAQQQAAQSARDMADGLHETALGAKGASGEIEKLTTDQANFNREVDQIKSRIQYFFGLSNAINLVKRAIRGAFDTIKQLDKAMTATAVVTDFDVSDMWEQLPEYTKRANELGVTTLAAYEAATLYYQQGLKTNEVNALSVETLKMARIAGLDAAEATDRMTNALRGFNMQLTEANAQRVDDVYSELAANTASNVDEISTAMTKVASLAHNANMEFETTAAFLSQIIETTRESAETAGTALKTVVARFSEVKKLIDEGSLRGTDEEGSTIDVNRVGQALRSAGIDLNKYFLGEVGLDDIFMELASKWDTLTSMQQRYIATQAAGSRQQSRFIALMSDYARTQELVGKAYDANGASARQFAKTQESLESKLARLKNAWDEFLMGLTNNEMVKAFVDGLTNLLNFLNKITSGFDSTTNSVLKFTAALAGFAGLKFLTKSGGPIDALFGTLLQGTMLGNGLLKGGILSGKVIGGAIPGSQAAASAAAAASATRTPLIFGSGSLLSKAGKGLWSGLQGLGGAAGVSKIPILGKAAGGLETALIGKGATAELAMGLTGVATALGTVAAAVGVVVAAYQAWLRLTPEGQLKQAKAIAEVMNTTAANTQKAAEEMRNASESYKEYNDAVKNAKTVEDRNEAIQNRNEYIQSLLEQNESLAQYVSTSQEGGQFVLTINEEQLAAAVKAVSEGAAEAAISANYANALQAGKQADVYQARIDRAGVDLENRTIRSYNESGNETTRALTDAEYAKFAQYAQAASNARAEERSFAQQAYQQDLADTGLKDDVATMLAGVLADTFDEDQYLKDINDKRAENWWGGQASRKQLEADYFNLYGVQADASMKRADLAKAVAQGQVDRDRSDNTEKLAELLQGDKADSYKALLEAWSGTGKMAEINLEGQSFEDILNQLGFNDLTQEQLAAFADALGITTDKLGEHIAAVVEDTKKIQAQARADTFETMMRAGMTITTADQERINGMSPAQIEQINTTVGAAEGLLSPEDYQQLISDLISGTIDEGFATQLTDLFNSINLDDPIGAFHELAEAKEEAANAGNDGLVDYIDKIQQANESLFTASNLVQSFIISADYEELTESLDKFIEENGHISAKNIEELASSSGKLKQLLDSNTVSAKALANALTLIQQGKLNFDQLNDAMLKALGTGKSFTEVLEDVQDWIDNFDPGTDLKDGTEHIIEQLKNLKEYVDNWEFGNEPTENIYDHIFGEGTYQQLVEHFDNDFESFEKFVNGKIEKYSSWAENAGLGGIEAAAAKGVEGLRKIAGSGGEFFEWDLSQFSTTTEAIDSVASALGITQEAAEAFILSWQTHMPKLRTEWDQLNYETQLQTYIESLGDARIATEQDLIALGAAVDETGHVSAEKLQEIINKINEARKKAGKDRIEIPVVVNWQDDSGAALSGEDLLNKYKQQFGSESGEPITITIPIMVEGDTYTGETIKSTIDSAYKDLQQYINQASNTVDSEGLISHLLSQGLSQGQAEAVANDFVSELSGAMLTKTIQVPKFEELPDGSVQVTQEDVTVSADTMDGLRQAEEAALQKANYSLVAQGLAGIDTTNYQSNIAIATSNGVNTGAVEGWKTFIDNLGPVNVPVAFTGGTVSDATGGLVKSFAKGSENIPLSPGFALTGEEGPEIIWNKKSGYAYVTGRNGPEFQNLQPGDRVFNAAETSRIFRNSSFAKGGYFDSFADGGWKPPSDGSGDGGSDSGSDDSKKESNWRNELDWLYDLMEDIAEYERQQTILQAKYDLALKDITATGKDLFKLTQKELVNLQTQLEAQEAVQLKRHQQMAELQTQVNAAGYGKYVKYNEKDQTLEIDWDAIEKIQDKDKYDEVVEWINRMEEVQGQMDDAEAAMWDIRAQIQELQNRYLQAYLDFQQKVFDAVVKQYQDTIDNLSGLNDTLNNTNAQILDSIQKEIDLERQIRDNTEKEQNISDMEARLAYLQRDTTGANASEIRQLEQQLEEARQEYSDELVDQAVERLSEANDAAAQQRERQIELMQAQLDYWQESGALWDEVADLIAAGFDAEGSIIEGSELWDVLQNADNWDALSEAQKKNWANDLILETNQVGAHLIQLSGGNKVNSDKVRESIADVGGLLTRDISATADEIRSLRTTLTGERGGTPEHSYTAEKVDGYASGGTATSTAMALLHGTPQEPEYVLNARQTEAFLHLADVLPSALGVGTNAGNGFNGNVSFNVDVNVGSISNDYDVDRLVARIKEDLYDAASYRNGNVLGFLR